MNAVTIYSDFGAQENKICHCFHFFPIYLPWSDGTGCHDLSFWMLSFKPAFLLSFFTLIKRLFSSSSFSAIGVVSPAYLRLLVFLPAILIPACASCIPVFCMMCSASQADSLPPELPGDPQGEGSEKVMNSGRCPPTVFPFTPQKHLVRLRVLAGCRTFSGLSAYKCIAGASPVAPWEGIHLPGPETRLRFLTQEDPNAMEDSAHVTTAGWVCALWARNRDARSPRVLGPGLCCTGSGRSEKPPHRNRRKARSNKEDPMQPKRNSVKPEVWPRSKWVPRSFIQETGPFQDEMKSPLFGDLFWDSPPPQFVNCILHLRLGIRRQVCCDVKGTLFV